MEGWVSLGLLGTSWRGNREGSTAGTEEGDNDTSSEGGHGYSEGIKSWL